MPCVALLRLQSFMLKSKLSHNSFSFLYRPNLPHWSPLNGLFVIHIWLILLCVINYSKKTINFNEFINFFITFTVVSNASYKLYWQIFIVNWHFTASYRYATDVIYTVESRFDEIYIFLLALDWCAENITIITLMETDILNFPDRWVHSVIVDLVFYLPFKIPGDVNIMNHEITWQYAKLDIKASLFKWNLLLHCNLVFIYVLLISCF